MRNFQVRLADQVHEDMKAIAEEREISIADVVREALEIYVAGVAYSEQGRKLVWTNENTGERTELLIPAFLRSGNKAASKLVSFGQASKK
jgi:hypothetical protein